MNCFTIYTKLSDLISPVVFKGPLLFSDLLADEFFTAFYHYNKSEAITVHISQVLFAKISPVKDKSYVPVTISFHFFNHKLKLRNIIDAAGILLIHQRLTVIQIITYRIIKDWKSRIYFSRTEFYHTDISGFTILVC